MSEKQLPTNFLSLSRRKRIDVLVVFDFWNTYKGLGRWASHRKLSYDIVQAILKSLENYSVEEICGAIHNYSTVLLDDRYYWDYVWYLSTFLTVKHERRKDATRKWWQFLPENFIEGNYLKNGNGHVKEEIEDTYPLLTLKLIKNFGLLTNNKEFEPSDLQRVKFVKTSREMINFFERRYRGISENLQVEYLFNCLEKNYIDKGEVVYPGHLCSKNLWSIQLPQYLIELGIE